jgi:hypothetical protein
MADGVDDRSRIVRAVDDSAADSLPTSVRVRGGQEQAGASRYSPHSHKFVAATAALVGVAVAAIVIAVVVATHDHRPATSQQWSQWSPPDQGLAGEREIAAEVSPFYRATPASQLVVVTAQNIDANAASSSTGSSSGGTQIAVRDPSTGSLAAIQGNTAVYNLCGLGPSCAIATGTPSSARLLLLRREALELSLYTLKYINGVDNVVSILPPGRTTAQAKLTSKPPQSSATAGSSTIDLAVVFQRDAMKRYLDRPLSYTLPEQLPPTVSEMPNAPEAELVSVLTGEALFQQQTIQSQDGSNVLVLSSVPPQ